MFNIVKHLFSAGEVLDTSFLKHQRPVKKLDKKRTNFEMSKGAVIENK